MLAHELERGRLGMAADDPDVARHMLTELRGAAQGYAASGFPQAAGGVDDALEPFASATGRRELRRRRCFMKQIRARRFILFHRP